jgi:hypothetical protein
MEFAGLFGVYFNVTGPIKRSGSSGRKLAQRRNILGRCVG